MSNIWDGLYYEDGNLQVAQVRSDNGFTDLWVADELRDDIQEVSDVDGLFFDDKEHFAAWVMGGHVAAYTAEEIWSKVDE